MARTESLELLGEIIDRLEPVGGTEPGTPLRSADWNVMVEAVTSLARLVVSREETLGEQLEEGFAAAGHDHRGEANLTWFEPDTRQLLETATGGSIEQRLGLEKFDKTLGAMRADIKELRAEFDALRQGLDSLRDADFARARSQGRLQNDIESLRRLEGSFDNLSGRLNGLDEGIATVLTLEEQLRDDNGAPIDLSGFNSRIGELEVLRENLTTADGNVVRIREIESSIARLEQDVLGRDAIDGLIVTRVNDAGFLENPALLDRVSVRVSDELNPRISAIEVGVTDLQATQSELDASIAPLNDQLGNLDSRFAGFDARLDGAASLAPRLDGVEARISASEARESDLAISTGRIDRLDGSLNTLSLQIEGLNTSAAQAATNTAAITSLTRRTASLESDTEGVGDLSGRIDRLETRTGAIDGLTGRVSNLEGQSGRVETRLDLAEAELTALENTTTRVAGLERRTSGLEERQAGTDRRIEQLGTGANRLTEERISVLEERVADQGATLIQLRSTNTQPVLGARRDILGPDIRRPG